MNIDIRSAANGCIFRIRGDDDPTDVQEVVHQQTEDDEVDAFAEVLWFLLDHFGPSQSRYSPKRIKIVVEPGDKYEPPADR